MIIEKLTSGKHNVADFDCADDERYAPLNDYIRRYVSQNDRRLNTATYVLVTDEDQVAGYYTTTVKQVDADLLPPEEKAGMYPIPVALLGRLAVDKRYRRKGFGELLLVDALRRIARAGAEVGIRAVEVVAKDERARSFYARYGFTSLLDDTLHLYLPLKALAGSALMGGVSSPGYEYPLG